MVFSLRIVTPNTAVSGNPRRRNHRKFDPSSSTIFNFLRFVRLIPVYQNAGEEEEIERRERRVKEMGSEALHAVKVYRHLLKSVKKHIGQEDYKRHFTDFIVEEFRKNREVSDPSAIQNKLKLAHEYTFLLNSVHHQKELLYSYNIAVDRSDEVKRILGKSAASVGLQLPEVYQA